MKKVIVSSLILALGLNMMAIKGEDNRTEERVGFGSGFVIGAIAGGPVGAIIGAASGAWFGDKVNEAQKVEGLESTINVKTSQLKELKNDLQVADTQLSEARILLQNQTISQHKVSQQQVAISALKLDVMFRTNSSDLEDKAIDKLVPVALMLEQFDNFAVQLTSHGDVLGTQNGNRVVAEDRAIRIKQSLINAGIDTDRIHIVNLGKTEAQAEITDVEGRALERRVRIQFYETKTTAKPILAHN